jgi:hypothetical protein
MMHVKARDQHQYQQLGQGFTAICYFFVARLAVTWSAEPECACAALRNKDAKMYVGFAKIVYFSIS